MTRVAVVTGGTRGIGAAICEALKEGYKVAATYQGNDNAAKKFTDKTGIPAYKFDVSDFDACKEGLEKIESEVGAVDILVNNAGITRDSFLHKTTVKHWHEVLRTRSGLGVQYVAPCHRRHARRGFGRIISISSINGQAGQAGQTNYSAAKSRDHRLYQGVGAGIGQQGHHGQRDRSRATSNRDGARGFPRSLEQDRR